MLTYKQFLGEGRGVSLETRLWSMLEETKDIERNNRWLNCGIDDLNSNLPFNKDIVKRIEEELRDRFKYKNLKELIDLCVEELPEYMWEYTEWDPNEELTMLRYRPSIVEKIEHLSKVAQEYILKHRPDLASKIQNLDPALAKKYSYEKELGSVDL
jgi:hypothetical protein